MAKKSFLIHLDSIDTIDDLTDEQAGKIFKAMIDFNRGIETDFTGLMKAVFLPFKKQFIRDNEKYELICKRNEENGRNGGRPRTQTKPKETQSDNLGNVENPEKPDNKNKNDNKNDSDNENKPPPSTTYDEFMANKIKDGLLETAKSYFSMPAYQRAIELLCMNQNVSVVGLKNLAMQFNDHRALQGKVEATVEEWAKHFSNWLKDGKRIASAQEKQGNGLTAEQNREIFGRP